MKSKIFFALSLLLFGISFISAQQSCYEQYLRAHNMPLPTDSMTVDDSYDELKKEVIARQLMREESKLAIQPIRQPIFLAIDTLAGTCHLLAQDGTILADVHLTMVDSTWYMWLSVDPLADKYPGSTPYLYCNGNPIMFIDPDGRSTKVSQNDDGTYNVIGGDLNDGDFNIYLYSRDIDGNYTIQDGIVGVSTSITSFYCSEEDKWMGVINPKDYSGDEFLSKIMTGEISLIKYMYNALPQGLYDFKYSNGSVDVSDDKDNNSYYYRGMPVAVNRDGLLMYSSARDVGNIAAGFIGGSCGISWGACRLAFDLLESCQRGRLVVEGVSTQNAEEFGWNLGVLRKTRK